MPELALRKTAGGGLGFLAACVIPLVCGMSACPAVEALRERLLRVGLDQPYKTPSAAAGAARDGDEIEIQAGAYPGDVAVWSANRLTIRGVNGPARIEANGRSAQQKAIWVIRGDAATVENIEFSGCHVPDHNGAGIREEGKGLAVRHCSFHDNEDGILTGANPESDILIERSEFRDNGYGDGYSHNLYIGKVRTLTFRFCSSHCARGGHILKSRAGTNFIVCNSLMDEQEGTSSYVVDLPNGGRSFLIGNIIQHGPHAENDVAVSYAEEGARNAVQELYVVNNTYVNDRKPAGSFLRVAGAPKVLVINNLVAGSKIVLTGPGEKTNNLVTDEPGFADAARYDYRLTAHSPALGAGIDPGKAGNFSLVPMFYCIQPLGAESRRDGQKLNIGACPAEK